MTPLSKVTYTFCWSLVLIETPVTPNIPFSTQTQGEHDDLIKRVTNWVNNSGVMITGNRILD